MNVVPRFGPSDAATIVPHGIHQAARVIVSPSPSSSNLRDRPVRPARTHRKSAATSPPAPRSLCPPHQSAGRAPPRSPHCSCTVIVPLRRELHRILDQVPENLLQPRRIRAAHHWPPPPAAPSPPAASRPRIRPANLRAACSMSTWHPPSPGPDAACPAKSASRPAESSIRWASSSTFRRIISTPPAPDPPTRLARKQIHHRQDRRQRIPQLVAQDREKIVLRLVRRLPPPSLRRRLCPPPSA